jgi:dihydrofolate synthase / folylpolyglutamate synthase
MPVFASLDEWLHYQETLHDKPIDLGLNRVRAVSAALRLERPAPVCILVGGTNGKGSTCAFLDAIYRAAGKRVGLYTSPHLLRYNERIVIDGRQVDDQSLCDAFTLIEHARKDLPLTYFEFGTLAAFLLFKQANVDVAILEVGLGGRLDAVNMVDGDVAIVTSISMDHMEWLGADREKIGYEKAGIFRAGCPAICGDPDPPQRLVAHAANVGAALQTLHNDFSFAQGSRTWRWHGAKQHLKDLPPLPLFGVHQLQNASCALAAVEALGERLPIARSAIEEGLKQAHIPGRYQAYNGPFHVVLDVAHNEESARALCQMLKASPVPGSTYAVFGMMQRKDIAAAIRALDDVIDGWGCVDLPDGGAMPAKQLQDLVEKVHPAAPSDIMPSVGNALDQALSDLTAADRVVVFGSFVTVAIALQWLAQQPKFAPISCHSRDQ